MYIEFVDGKQAATRTLGTMFSQTLSTAVTVKCVISGTPAALEVFVGGTLRLTSGLVGSVFDGGGVGLFRGAHCVCPAGSTAQRFKINRSAFCCAQAAGRVLSARCVPPARPLLRAAGRPASCIQRGLGV